MTSPSTAGFPLAGWLRDLFGRRVSAQPPERLHPFDVRHSVDTDGLLYADDLATGHAHDPHNEGYYATAPSLFLGAMAQWQETLSGHSLEDYAFLDLGCGKGRVLLLASQSPFRSIRGIELNPALVRSARRNLRRWLRRPRACPRITIDQVDALNLELPDNPVLLFLFNSFGAEVLAPLMAKLAASASRRTTPIDLIYVHPDHGLLVASTLGIKLLRSTEVAFSEEDAQADAFNVSSDTVSIYRLPPARPDLHHDFFSRG